MFGSATIDIVYYIVYMKVNDRGVTLYIVLIYQIHTDFYDFQINLLNEYPVEAGKADRERILPYMPGPLTQVDEDITGKEIPQMVCVMVD